MPYTEQQQAEIKKEFAARRHRQTLLAIPLVLFMVLAVAMRACINVDPFGGSMNWFGPVFVTFVVGAVVFSLINWRCPACQGSLGREVNPRFCSKCGTELH